MWNILEVEKECIWREKEEVAGAETQLIWWSILTPDVV